jgi:Uma2 family endonuclease
MVALPQKMRMTEAEYLEFERKSESKHEFIDGEVFAMSGASRAHNLICTQLITILTNQLHHKDYEVYLSLMRVKISANKYVYPDVSVVSGEAQLADEQLDNLLNPILIIEVLSDSTEAYDRGLKFRNYRQLASLQEYVLIAQDKPSIERFVRQADGTWNIAAKDAEGLDSSVELTSIGCTLHLAEVYERVVFPEVLTESVQEAWQAMLATENVLKEIWDAPEEDEAWSHL